MKHLDSYLKAAGWFLLIFLLAYLLSGCGKSMAHPGHGLPIYSQPCSCQPPVQEVAGTQTSFIQ